MVLCGEDWTALVGSTLEILKFSSYQQSVHLANSARRATWLLEHTRCLPAAGYLVYAILYPTVFSQQRGCLLSPPSGLAQISSPHRTYLDYTVTLATDQTSSFTLLLVSFYYGSSSYCK